MVLDEAAEKGADDAAERKGAVEEAIRLRSGPLAENSRAFLFLLVDAVDDVGEHRRDDEGDGEADEGEKCAEEDFLFQARVGDIAEKHVERDGKEETAGGKKARAMSVGEVT